MTRTFDDATPIYLQIAEEIRAQILSLALPEGAQVTSTTEYATRYRINPATANKAIALLVAEGLVVKQRGVGMFVADGARERLASARRATYVQDTLAPALEAGRILGLTDDEVLAAVRTRLSRAPGPSTVPDDEPTTPPTTDTQESS